MSFACTLNGVPYSLPLELQNKLMERPPVATNVFKYQKTVQKKEIDKEDRKDLKGRSNQKYHMYVSKTTDRIWYEIDKEGFVPEVHSYTITG